MTATRTAQHVKATPEAVYAAFMDPAILVQWLPPADMTGVINDFEARVGGGYRMTLTYAAGTNGQPGKTTANEDSVIARFTELSPPRRIVETGRFVTNDPALAGEMTMTITIEPVPGGSTVTMAFEDLPPGLNPKDNDEGTRLSLQQLARRFA